MNLAEIKGATRRIKKKVNRKMSTITFPDGLSELTETKSAPDSVLSLSKYNIDAAQLAVNLERSLSSSSDQESNCWTPDKILSVIDGLRLPIEVLIKVMQAIKATFSK